ncbi:MAG: hypothetical protein M1828_004089 [Chrysothrix sp. TS-e1954]|nr:MAG: hypothetical protein M1828_004089 [Chrysothrix sp. TS-e1954]
MATVHSPPPKVLNIDNINSKVKTAQYAVRGELAVRADKYRQKLSHNGPPTPPSTDGGDDELPFDSVISANIGNPQQLDQKPITFFRQVASLLENPMLMEHGDVLVEKLGYKQDVLDRARRLLQDVHSVGAYSQSQGSLTVRQSVARFIEQRDGHPSSPDSIFLTAGASSGVSTLMNIICANPSTGILVPIPQYPLYTATLSLMGAHCVRYYLDEAQNWATDLSAIRSSLESARKEGIDVRGMVVINPGNPTGGSLSGQSVEELVKFAAEERLVLLGDEVYQTNVFEGQFHSFKRALRDLQQRHPQHAGLANLELASLHSISKGMVGECGHRGGYMELTGFDPQVVEQIYKFVSISLCPPVTGQCIVEMMVNPPQPGEPSYPLYSEEYTSIFHGLKDRASALYDAFKAMEGVECQSPQGSMYLYPTISLPKKAQKAAEEQGKKPDEFYISRMLDATGVCMVPGTGFGQKEGTCHFRTTFLAPGTEWVGRVTDFHKGFMDEFR